MQALLGLTVLLVGARGEVPKTVRYAWRPVHTFDRDAPATLRFGQPFVDDGRTVGVGAFAPEKLVHIAHGERRLEFSLDGGENWRRTPSLPRQGEGGDVSASADGRIWVYNLPDGSYRTEDYGFVWTPCEELPAGVKVVADRTSPLRFYALGPHARVFYTSIDGAKTFQGKALTLHAGSSSDEGNRLYATPGRSGDLWIVVEGSLYHAPPGHSFAKADGLTNVRALGFGRGALGGTGSALYLVGAIAGLRGTFRSDDGAQSWVVISDHSDELGMVLQIEGDPKRYGRVYVRYAGRETLYGDPS